MTAFIFMVFFGVVGAVAVALALLIYRVYRTSSDQWIAQVTQMRKSLPRAKITLD